jgi:hypothetical protein
VLKLRDRLRSGDDEAHVGVFGFIERRRHANDDRVRLAQDGAVGRGIEAAGRDMRRQVARGHVRDVRGARVEDPHLLGIIVEPRHTEPRPGEFGYQGQTDIADSDDYYVRLLGGDLGKNGRHFLRILVRFVARGLWIFKR